MNWNHKMFGQKLTFIHKYLFSQQGQDNSGGEKKHRLISCIVNLRYFPDRKMNSSETESCLKESITMGIQTMSRSKSLLIRYGSNLCPIYKEWKRKSKKKSSQPNTLNWLKSINFWHSKVYKIDLPSICFGCSLVAYYSWL